MSEILETIKKELLRWPDVTAEPHKFGGIDLRLVMLLVSEPPMPLLKLVSGNKLCFSHIK